MPSYRAHSFQSQHITVQNCMIQINTSTLPTEQVSTHKGSSKCLPIIFIIPHGSTFYGDITQEIHQHGSIFPQIRHSRILSTWVYVPTDSSLKSQEPCHKGQRSHGLIVYKSYPHHITQQHNKICTMSQFNTTHEFPSYNSLIIISHSTFKSRVVIPQVIGSQRTPSSMHT